MKQFIALLIATLTACSSSYPGDVVTPKDGGGDDDDGTDAGGGGGDDGGAPIVDAAPAAIDCSTRPPPAGWTRMTSGNIQNYSGTFYFFKIDDSTKWANMFGFNPNVEPIDGTVMTGYGPYTEKVGHPSAIFRPNFPGSPAANAVYGDGAAKSYYALEFTIPQLPVGGVNAFTANLGGSTSNGGHVSTVSVSECPGDFDATKLNSATSTCLYNHFFPEGPEFTIETGHAAGSLAANAAQFCHLQQGKKYYFNVAPSKDGDWTQSTCTQGVWCWTTIIASGAACDGANGMVDCENYYRNNP
ncbi:MAG TPA: hypothetical protein VGM39_16285 [Kofleriaceae bacterium]|jgi:hypothetical protein